MAALLLAFVGCQRWQSNELRAPTSGSPTFISESRSTKDGFNSPIIKRVRPTGDGSDNYIYMPVSGGVCGCWTQDGKVEIYIEEVGELHFPGGMRQLLGGDSVPLSEAWGKDVVLFVRHRSGYLCHQQSPPNRNWEACD